MYGNNYTSSHLMCAQICSETDVHHGHRQTERNVFQGVTNMGCCLVMTDSLHLTLSGLCFSIRV